MILQAIILAFDLQNERPLHIKASKIAWNLLNLFSE